MKNIFLRIKKYLDTSVDDVIFKLIEILTINFDGINDDEYLAINSRPVNASKLLFTLV